MNALILGSLWVVAATVVALLPMRFQILPGLALLAAAPWLIWRIGVEFGWLPSLLALAAFVSMFRKPLRYLALRTMGRSRDEAMGQTSGEGVG
jgi:thiol:disulfide interchange protein